jgi:hypothetical protein
MKLLKDEIEICLLFIKLNMEIYFSKTDLISGLCINKIIECWLNKYRDHIL